MKIRQRFIYGRLCSFRRGVTVHKLGALLGGLMDRATIVSTLAQLESFGLVQAVNVGKRVKWVVVREIPVRSYELFVWRKDGEADCWKCILPATNPFKGKGGLEKWLVLAFTLHLRSQGKKWKAVQIARTLGLCVVVVRRNVNWLKFHGFLGDTLPVPVMKRLVSFPKKVVAADKAVESIYATRGQTAVVKVVAS